MPIRDCTGLTRYCPRYGSFTSLPHRIRRGPFQQTEITTEDLQERIDQLQGGQAAGEPEPVFGEPETSEKKKG